MGELLVSGPPERPRRGWPWLVAAVVVLLAAAALAAPRLLGGSIDEPSRGQSASPSADPSPAPSPRPEEDLARPRLDGVRAALPPGVALALGGPRPTVVGAADRAAGLSQVPLDQGDTVSGVLPAPGGLLVLVLRGQFSAAQPALKVYLVRGSRDPLLLTQADQVVIGHREDRIFASRYGPDPSRQGTLQEVSWSGRVLARHSTPPGFDLYADASAGLLVTIRPSGDGPADLRIVDRHSLATVRHLARVGYPVAATSTWVAWTTFGCESVCVLTVADLPSGARRTIRLARGFQPGAAAFSPDRRHIAIGYYGRHPQQAGGTAPGFVEVTDLTTGTTTRIPGVASSVKMAPDLAWIPDGSGLVLSVGFPDTDLRLAGIWPLTGGPVHVLPRTFSGGSAPSALLALPSVGR